jgi:hypothetical protein
MVKSKTAQFPIHPRIVQVRGRNVMIDADLRFPDDFMFHLKDQDVANLRSQIVTSSSSSERGWGGRRTMPYACSEQGVAMLSSVLRSERAIAVNIAIMRAFVRLRELARARTELSRKLDELDRRVSGHDSDIANIVRAIRQLATPAEVTPKRRIGFISD